jgi:hypothetical protein
MAFRMHKVQVWSCEVPDRPGAAAGKLELLARAGADLEFIFTLPAPGKPDSTVLFLAPIQGNDQTQAAQQAGFTPSRDLAMLCVEGDNRQGLGYKIMYGLAVAGINVRGLSVSAVGDRFAAYIAFADADAVTLAIQILANLQP